VATESYDLIYREAVRSLTQQQQSLDGLRARAGGLISATAIATSFLGGLALAGETSPGNELEGFSWAGIILFCLIILLNMVIVAPWWTWTFETSPTVLVQSVDSGQADAARLARDLALYFEIFWEDNQRKLNILFLLFQAGAILLIVEIIVWIFELAG
jgi:hypothetical protein